MASVYKKGERWWLRFKGADGRWQGAPVNAVTKPAARLEALERERLARQQRDGLAPSSDNQRRTFGELMDLWQERYGSRLRSQTIQQSVEKHLRPALGKLRLGGAAAELPALLNTKIGELSPSSLNHLRAYCHRLYAVASMRSVGWWMVPNPVNRLELPKFKEARRKRATVAAEDVPRVLAALTPEWRPLFATAFFLGMRRGELLALQKDDVDLREWTITVRRSGDADVTKGGDDGTVPIPEPLRPYIDAAIKLSPSKWIFPAADGAQRAPDTNVKAVLVRALGRAGIVEGYEHRCRKPSCGHVEPAADSANRRCPKDGRALWIRPLPKKGIVFHSLRHTTATLLARAKVHPSVAQKILRHANIETTLAIYTHLDGIEDMRAAVAKLDFGPLEERAPAPVVPLRKNGTFATNLLPAASFPKDEASDRPDNVRKIRGLAESGRLDLNQRPLAPQPRQRASRPLPAAANHR
jgi:integrase